MTKQEALSLFNQMHPDFFSQSSIVNMDETEIMEEQILELAHFDKSALNIPVPENITFGWYQGDAEKLLKAVAEVEEEWAQFDIFKTVDRVFCAMARVPDPEKPGLFKNEIASFCVLEDMGTHELGGRKIKIGGPGCVGTVPAFRRKGIGLKMVQEATQILREEGFELSWIHWTGVGHWYARLGYLQVLQWNKNGII